MQNPICVSFLLLLQEIATTLKTTGMYSEFWGLEVQNQGVSRIRLTPKCR